MQFGWTGKLNTSHHITFTGCTGCTGALNTNHHITLTGWTGELKTSHHITLTGCTGCTGELSTSHHITLTGCTGWSGEHRDVNIEFFPNLDIECDNPVKIRISDFIRAA